MEVMRSMLLAGGLLLTAVAAADPGPAVPDRPLTLLELSDLALRNHPSTRAAWADVRQSQAAETIARAAYWPTLTAAYSWTRSKSIANEGREIPRQTRYGPSVSVSWMLLDFGARAGTADQAAAQVLAAQLTRDQTLADLLLAVESAYYARIGTEAVEDAMRRSLEEARVNAEAARARHQAGVATIADVYQAEAAFATATLVSQQAEGARLIAAGDLAVAAGYAPDTPIALAPWTPPENPELPPQPV
ncbi:MAG TPA: TolC family protein, partial [Nevskiaceae bacterium]|nr:TolC family protein [Nevskiaceae bacterium]